MSEKILKALMHLFAIIGNNEKDGAYGRNTVEFFLRQQLNKEQVDEYLKLYDEHCKTYHKTDEGEKKKKRTAVSSVKVVVICRHINEELTQKQKILVLLRLIEFVRSGDHVAEQELEFVNIVSSSFNIPEDEYAVFLSYVLNRDPANTPDSADILIINNQAACPVNSVKKYLYSEGLSGELHILRIKSAGIYLVKYYGDSEIYLNGQFIAGDRIYLLTQGSTIRSTTSGHVYYSDIVGTFLSDDSRQKISFDVKHIEYVFSNGKKGLHDLSFSEDSGKMIGIMGGSGAGKSTLLNILNGNDTPSSGQVLINGTDLHKEKKKMEGVVGYVPQDDLLIDELTVYQNLFYNTKLCFAHYSNQEIDELVNKLLLDLGLDETRDLKVGNPLRKTISGGQRKRLNIGLELIREPAVLFVDEPTSGLSSRDSENIMDLLKELSLKGKLVFVVIHQPSSDIYKMFDKLLILDLGGYPIYYGNPVEALVYFKSAVNHINANDAQCEVCGTVNPEQIFNIIESKVLDENGIPTYTRKISPQEWNELFIKKYIAKENNEVKKENVETNFRKPGFFSQMKVYLTRDVLSKFANTQYLAINFLEAPVLAFILAFLTKFYKNNSEYVFSENKNLVAYIFMCVVVSLFVGLTVSAEEIIRDRKILKRESFRNLSRGSYLLSKIVLLFFISAVQTYSFVLVGNSILEIHNMNTAYWIVLFTTSCFANMLGLNISSTFDSAVTIYILIPFLLIPQLLLSGVIVKFDELHPALSGKSSVPLTGDLMTSRWAFEALAVNQFQNNEYEKNIYPFEKQKSNAQFKKAIWYDKMKELTKACEEAVSSGKKNEQYNTDLKLLADEIQAEQKISNIPFTSFNDLKNGAFSKKTAVEINSFIDQVKKQGNKIYNEADSKRDAWFNQFLSTEEGKEQMSKLKRENENQSLKDLVTNSNNPLAEKFFIENGKIYPNNDIIFVDAPQGTFVRSQFFSPNKYVFGNLVPTFWVNLMVIWFMSFVMYITLYYDVFRKMLEGIGKLMSRNKVQ